MQDVLVKELSVRKSAVPKWKAQCVEKIFELAKLSTQQPTLPTVVAAAAATIAPPAQANAAVAPAAAPAHADAAAAIAAASAAAAAAVRGEDEADESLRVHVEQQRTTAAAAELEAGDEPDTARGDEPIVFEEVEAEGGEAEVAEAVRDEASYDEGDTSETTAATSGEEVCTAAIAALQELVEQAESDPDGATDTILAAPSIWRCCSSEAKTAAWKCGGCNLWTHRMCQQRACGKDSANPLCSLCFEAAATSTRESGARNSRRVR